MVAARWLIGVAMTAALTMPPVPAHSGDAPFRHGIAISHAMAWAPVDAGRFVFPPFAEPGHALQAIELQSLRRAGFNFVRLAVDPGPFLQFHGQQRGHMDRLLLERLRSILASGLAVIVDVHPSDLDPRYTGGALMSGASTPLFQDYLRFLERTAGLLDALRSPRVALELMNEPPGPTHLWQPVLEAAYAAVRRRAPNLLLVVGGGQEGMPAGLTTLSVRAFRGDPALLYTFHYYEPFQFTHQGASWNAARHLADVPYPARARPLRDSLAATAAVIEGSGLPPAQKLEAMAEARRMLEDYHRSDFGRTSIARAFGRVAGWAQRNGIPADRILLGEFGVMRSGHALRGARAPERQQWFADVRAEAKSHGFRWAAWAWRDDNFGLANRDGEIDPAMIEALGLRTRLPHGRASAE
jgi:endoglucanase